MQTEHQSSGGVKVTTTHRKLLATAIIGAALIGYQVHKTPDARSRLEKLASLAHLQGYISDGDAATVAQLLAQPPVTASVTHLVTA